MARRAPRRLSMVRSMSSSRACVMTMSVTSSGTSFSSMSVAHRAEIRVGRGGEAHFDFLEPHVDEHLEQALLGLAAHRLEQRLVAIAQVGAAPDRRGGELARRPLAVGQGDGGERTVSLRRIFQHDGIAHFSRATDETSPAEGQGRLGFQSCWRRLVARVFIAPGGAEGGAKAREPARTRRLRGKACGARSEPCPDANTQLSRPSRHPRAPAP